MDKKAQGSLEYLLLIMGAVLVAILVIAIILSSAQETGTTVAEQQEGQTKCAARTGVANPYDACIDTSGNQLDVNPEKYFCCTPLTAIGGQAVKATFSRCSLSAIVEDIADCSGGLPPVSPITYSLTTNVNPAGAGRIERNATGPTYNAGSQVQLTANANAEWKFENWSGNASGTNNPTTITMDSNKNITANFSKLCGNGIINPGEQCDGTNLNGKTCSTLGASFPRYAGGRLSCNANCTFNTSNCTGLIIYNPSTDGITDWNNYATSPDGKNGFMQTSGTEPNDWIDFYGYDYQDYYGSWTNEVIGYQNPKSWLADWHDYYDPNSWNLNWRMKTAQNGTNYRIYIGLNTQSLRNAFLTYSYTTHPDIPNCSISNDYYYISIIPTGWNDSVEHNITRNLTTDLQTCLVGETINKITTFKVKAGSPTPHGPTGKAVSIGDIILNPTS